MGTTYHCSCVTYCIKWGVWGVLPAVGAIKVGAGKGSTMQPLLQHPDPEVRMTAVLPSLVLTLLCLMRAGAEVPVQLDFDPKKFAGMWHIMAAVSNCPVFLSMKDKMTSSVSTISFTPEGHMAMETVLPLPEECKKISMLFQRSGQAGHYISTEKGEKRDLRVMDTDYEHYAIVYSQLIDSQKPSTALQLYTRNQDVSSHLLQKFKELFHSMGLTEDMLVVMPHSDRCTKTHK
ncbi:lipocalin-15-like [Coturnix japonica]|uniref:Lipocalin-15-like n=1 Tax=Coturnix japonica TaxID=93934 RepID=A0A8C2YE00_COTJA|nr:lipocalin-15-like [Coturnix japonica]